MVQSPQVFAASPDLHEALEEIRARGSGEKTPSGASSGRAGEVAALSGLRKQGQLAAYRKGGAATSESLARRRERLRKDIYKVPHIIIQDVSLLFRNVLELSGDRLRGFKDLLNILKPE
ncbi:hypothetical protein NDU88_001812 [Pleurodeles waltl]|uniref:Uncharacterized protein n=1 Tax=Pleurodeles waltl TaxID=8319 RepID=A0AAV7U901_PLEWA|nr:hypothetical protein NDU88_001812 [Pleurodeles waltl]